MPDCGKQAEIQVAAGIIFHNDSILAAKRPAGKPLAGYWELPGGKLEFGEAPEDALCRELAEELAIHPLKYVLLDTVDHCYSDQHITVKIYFFLVRSFLGEPCSREGQELRWIDIYSAAAMNFLPADMRVIAELPAYCAGAERALGAFSAGRAVTVRGEVG